MLPGKDCLLQRNKTPVIPDIYIFYHYDSVCVFGHGAARVDPEGILVDFKTQGLARGSCKSLFGKHGKAVHRGPVKGR